jgi:exopolyphosphatase / guanosine-5'-triphosphate,3'-diphosphate pyrophosphatase
MKPVRRAVIDVGTNSVKLLVADVADRHVEPVLEESQQTRLGAGFYQTRLLQPGAIAQTASAAARFAQTASEHQSQSLRLIATSAARDALNAEQLVDALEQAAHVPVEIISGEQEADWVFQGAATDPTLAHAPLLLLDVGGGSAEVIVGREGQSCYRASFPLGTVRLLELLAPADPPRPQELADCRQWIADFLLREVQPSLAPQLQFETSQGQTGDQFELVGTGGTPSILARMEKELGDFDRQQIEATRLSLTRLHWHVERLWSLGLDERKRVVGLPPSRADVILTGAAIYEVIMKQFGFAELRVSTRGLRFAAVLDPPAGARTKSEARACPDAV